MRQSRLLSILMILQTRGRTTAEALAAEFEVSVRTIYRDIDALSAAAVPVYADRGPGGGFQLLDGYRTKLTGLSPAEAETLFLAGLPAPAAELGLADVLTTAQLKLTAALPERTRASAHRVAQRFHLDPVDWFRSADAARLLPEIAKAVWSETCVDIRYKRGAGAVTRRLKPLGLVLKAGTWYAVAQVDEQTRTYRVANVLDLTATDQRFERPRDFDLVRFWTLSTRTYEIGLHRAKAVLRLSPQGLAGLSVLGAAVQQAATDSAGPPEKDGWVRATVPIESVERTVPDLLRLGTDVEVLEPRTLRHQMAKAAREIARLYG